MPHQGEWHPGRHEPLTDRETWDRVQTLLGSKVDRSHELVYAGGLIACGRCGHTVTGERVKKKLKAGETFYVDDRCSKYRSAGHPPVRLREADLDGQVLDLFGRSSPGTGAASTTRPSAAGSRPSCGRRRRTSRKSPASGGRTSSGG